MTVHAESLSVEGLFDAVSVSVRAGERVALVGPNGAGKSTLLRLLAETHPRAALLPQEALTVDRCVGEFVTGEPWEVDAALRRMHVEHIGLDRPFGSLSGGEAARVLLASVYASDPDVLLLDEPTNHLDLDGLALLEDELNAFRGSVLVVSHDRRFLDATVSRVLELEHGELVAYDGGYTKYRAEKRRRREKLTLQLEAQRKRRSRAEADVAAMRQAARTSERKASGLGSDTVKRKAKMLARKAHSRERRLAREMESEHWARPPRDPTPLKPSFAPAADAGRLVARLDRVSARVLHDVSLSLHAGARVALVGPNGAGKSTLLALLAGTLRADAGDVDVRVDARLLPQRAVALPLDTPLWTWFRDEVRGPQERARTLLAHFRFDEDALRRPLGRLSPGERSRAHVAAMVGAEAPLLLLDEPTNHLDFDTLDTLEEALRAHAGTIVAVSHDRAFLDGIGVQEVIEVRDGRLLRR